MKKALSQAKILAIDKNKGRVTLAMKNGLISTGTYLYDLNDLKENMTVLVGKVSGSYVIMNKVAANPKNSSGVSIVKPENVEGYGIHYIRCTSDGSPILIDDYFNPLPDFYVWGGYRLMSVWSNPPEGNLYYEDYAGAVYSKFPNMIYGNGIKYDENLNLWYNDGEGLDTYFRMYSVTFSSTFASECVMETLLSIPSFSSDYMKVICFGISDPYPYDQQIEVGFSNNIPRNYVYIKVIKINNIWDVYYKYVNSDNWNLVLNFESNVSFTNSQIYFEVFIGNEPYLNLSNIMIMMCEYEWDLPLPLGHPSRRNRHEIYIGFSNHALG